MIPASFDLTIYQGTTFNKTFNAVTGIDFEDYDGIRMQIRSHPITPKSKTIWDSRNTDTGSIRIVSSTQLALTIPAIANADFDFNIAGFDIELFKNANGGNPEVVDRLVIGKVTLIREHTKQYISA